MGNSVVGHEFKMYNECTCRWRAEKEELQKMLHEKHERGSGTIRWPTPEKNLLEQRENSKE